MAVVYRKLLVLFLFATITIGFARAQETSPDSIEPDSRADWIPVGAVSPGVERRAIETRARIETRVPMMQREALRGIKEELRQGNHVELRIATVPLVIELLDLEYTILEFPRDYRIDGQTRMLALEVLAELGGSEARRQLRKSVLSDDDETIRAGAAQLLASHSGSDPETDLRVVSQALSSAVQKGAPASEVTRLLRATRVLAPRVWDPEVPILLETLVAIHQGGYSGSLRREAFAFLEWLADR